MGNNYECEYEFVCQLNPRLKGKDIVIFGTGKKAIKAFYFFFKSSVPVICFADRDEGLRGEWILGKRIVYEDDLINKGYSIVICSEHWSEIFERLKAKGLENLYIWNYEIDGDDEIMI